MTCSGISEPICCLVLPYEHVFSAPAVSIQSPHWNTQCRCTLDAVIMPVRTRLNIVPISAVFVLCFHLSRRFSLLLYVLPSGFWSHLTSLEALCSEELQAACPQAQPQGPTTAGAENLASWRGMWSLCLSPGMQIYDPRGDADSYTEWLIYSKHSPGRGLRVWKYSMRTRLHTLTTFTNGYVKQGCATPFRQA